MERKLDSVCKLENDKLFKYAKLKIKCECTWYYPNAHWLTKIKKIN